MSDRVQTELKITSTSVTCFDLLGASEYKRLDVSLRRNSTVNVKCPQGHNSQQTKPLWQVWNKPVTGVWGNTWIIDASGFSTEWLCLDVKKWGVRILKLDFQSWWLEITSQSWAMDNMADLYEHMRMRHNVAQTSAYFWWLNQLDGKKTTRHNFKLKWTILSLWHTCKNTFHIST